MDLGACPCSCPSAPYYWDQWYGAFREVQKSEGQGSTGLYLLSERLAKRSVWRTDILTMVARGLNASQRTFTSVSCVLPQAAWASLLAHPCPSHEVRCVCSYMGHLCRCPKMFQISMVRKTRLMNIHALLCSQCYQPSALTSCSRA